MTAHETTSSHQTIMYSLLSISWNTYTGRASMASYLKFSTFTWNQGSYAAGILGIDSVAQGWPQPCSQHRTTTDWLANPAEQEGMGVEYWVFLLYQRKEAKRVCPAALIVCISGSSDQCGKERKGYRHLSQRSKHFFVCWWHDFFKCKQLLERIWRL